MVSVSKFMGSPPLTRGKRQRGGENRARWRLIPAHAGKTRVAACPEGVQEAHPRSRGENRAAKPYVPRYAGSSPLTRGKRFGHVGPDGLPRLIPAHAGKTGPQAHEPQGRWAHPRSRGENTPPLRQLSRDRGSSPLTRGKRWPCRWPARRTRLIPAHAGKTSLVHSIR